MKKIIIIAVLLAAFFSPMYIMTAILSCILIACFYNGYMTMKTPVLVYNFQVVK